ncbi:MAG: flavodoxin, partial [Comamonadaceae bacterium]
MDAILVVCYSHTGTSRRAAELLCSHHGWPLGEITDASPRGSLRCVVDSLLRRRPRIRYEGPEPASYRTVVLVAPIWMYRLAAPMRSFIAQRREALPRIAMIATMNSGGANN